MLDRANLDFRRGIGLVTLLVTGLAFGAVHWPDRAEARESDDSRLGARAIEVGSTQQDSLEPPEDSSDWRYVKIKSDRELQVRVELGSGNASVTLRMTEAAGDEIATVDSSGGAATVRKQLSPGIYYLQVESDDAVSYAITVE